MKYIGYALLLGMILSSCSSTQHVYLNVQEPATVRIPPQVKTVAVLNRSMPGKHAGLLDAIDKAVTLEGPNLDKEGASSGISGFTDELARSSRFTVERATDTRATNSGVPGLFPAPLSWGDIDQLCRDNQADAVMALEIFDTDTRVNYSAIPASIKTPLGNVPVLEQQADMETIVKSGWRLYDATNHLVLDEFSFARPLHYSAKGITPAVAVAGIMGRKDAVKEAAYAAGRAYAFRLSPRWLRVYRDYYVKGSPEFVIGRRFAQTGNWKGAEACWNRETTNPRPKIAGRACYNMAIISEINGDLDQAITWASRSYEQYNNKLALYYLNTLKNRVREKATLDTEQSGQ